MSLVGVDFLAQQLADDVVVDVFGSHLEELEVGRVFRSA